MVSKAIAVTQESWDKLAPMEQYEFMLESPVYVIDCYNNVKVIGEIMARNGEVYNFARMLEKDFPEHLHEILSVAFIAWNAIESDTSQSFVLAEANGEISVNAAHNSLFFEFYLNNVNTAKLHVFKADVIYFGEEV